MGSALSSFLDKPITKKESTDESSNKFICGTSSMQGWRDSQEDAHNAILEYDTDAAFFAVYDGHGGAEVSEYCSLKLPQYIKDSDDYKNGKIEEALINCFLSFDQIFKTTEFADELNKIRPRRESAGDAAVGTDGGGGGDDDNNSVVEENIDNLYKEATMPIEKVIEKYATESLKTNQSNDQNENDTSACSSSSSKASTSQNSTLETNIDDGVSSSSESKKQCNTSNNNNNNNKNNNSNNNIENLENETTKNHVPDSSDMKKEISNSNDENNKQNSEAIAKSNDENETTKNGEIKKDKGKNVIKPDQAIRKSLRQQAAQIYKQFLENDSDEDDDSDSDSSSEEATVESSEDDCANTAIEIDDSSEEVQDDDDDDDDDEADEDEEDSDDDYRRYKAGYNSGCTAVVALLKGNQLYVANIGDSRCLVCRNGEIIEMSFDHKPTDDPELQRITKAGGRVVDERVEGGLNLSRAFGDHSYKKNKQLTDREQMITALPDIKQLTLKPNEDEFMFLACDGIWNSMTTEECVDFLRTRLQQEGREKLSEICEEMFDSCLTTEPFNDSKGNDNMTAVLIKFKWNIPKRASSPSAHLESDAKRVKTDDKPQIDTTV